MSETKYQFVAYATVAYYDSITTAIIDIFDTPKEAVDAAVADVRATFSDDTEFNMSVEEVEEKVSEAEKAIERYGDYEFKDWDAVEEGTKNSDELGYYLWGYEKKLRKEKKAASTERN